MMGVLIPSVMALRETAMTAPLGQQGEPRTANGRPYWFLIGSRKNRGIATPVCGLVRNDMRFPAASSKQVCVRLDFQEG